MPFTYDQIPLDVLVNEPLTSAIWCLVVPCVLLPLAVTVGYATWLISGYLPQWLVSTNYALAALSVFSSLAGLGGEGSYEPELMTMLLLFVIGFGSAAWLSMGDVARIPAVRNIVMMQCIYIVPMAFWVTFAQKDFQIGAWLGAVHAADLSGTNFDGGEKSLANGSGNSTCCWHYFVWDDHTAVLVAGDGFRQPRFTLRLLSSAVNWRSRAGPVGVNLLPRRFKTCSFPNINKPLYGARLLFGGGDPIAPLFASAANCSSGCGINRSDQIPGTMYARHFSTAATSESWEPLEKPVNISGLA